MARFDTIPAFTGTIGPVCIYRMHGQYFMRSASSLTGHRVKTDPAFRKTMQYAALLANASRIASAVYAGIPAGRRQHALYRKLTGEAMTWLRYHWTAPDIIAYLQKQYGQMQLPPDYAHTRINPDYGRKTPQRPFGKRTRLSPPAPFANTGRSPFGFRRSELRLRLRRTSRDISSYPWALSLLPATSNRPPGKKKSGP